jgi:hypothetical protein
MSVLKFLFLAAVALGFAGGCSSSSPARTSGAADSGESPYVYTGQVPGTDVLVAIVATPGHARVYFCGGPSSYATLTHWFAVDLDASGKAVSQFDGGGWSLQMQVEGTGVVGSMTSSDGATRAFATRAVASGAIAGLYETVAAPCGRIGLIVIQSGAAAMPTGQGACIGLGAPSGSSRVLQVNPLRPIVRTPEGAIAVVVAGTTAEVLALPAAVTTN